MGNPHLLILGGTGDARQLAERLCARRDLRITLSMAGRTKTPLPQAVTTRFGGFGGADGLATFLEHEHVDLIVDATHPFAAQISANAWAASQLCRTPLMALDRPSWGKTEGDNWIEVADVASAAHVLGAESRTVFLTIGRQELAPFKLHGQHRYVVRSIDPADISLPNATVLLDRGPFEAAAEEALMLAHAIDTLVTKNSGGAATYGKIVAARRLGLPVVMVQRPRPSGAPTAPDVADLMDWIDAHLSAFAERGA